MGASQIMEQAEKNSWSKGAAPIAVILISLNEGHNLEGVLNNLKGWAQEVFLVDSCSSDETVDIALRFGIKVVQRQFTNFGDQWNFALNNLPIKAPWTMKLDPDERLSEELKSSLISLVNSDQFEGISLERRLWFMGSILPVSQSILRLWRSGKCKFTEVPVNEHPIIEGRIGLAKGYLEHHDSPDLEHWISKQNRYTTLEAINQFCGGSLAFTPKFFGSKMQRRMWIKQNFWSFPGRYTFLFIYYFIFLGAWRVGRVGWIWSVLRVSVYRLWEYKKIEMKILGRVPKHVPTNVGSPDSRVIFFNSTSEKNEK